MHYNSHIPRWVPVGGCSMRHALRPPARSTPGPNRRARWRWTHHPTCGRCPCGWGARGKKTYAAMLKSKGPSSEADESPWPHMRSQTAERTTGNRHSTLTKRLLKYAEGGPRPLNMAPSAPPQRLCLRVAPPGVLVVEQRYLHPLVGADLQLGRLQDVPQVLSLLAHLGAEASGAASWQELRGLAGCTPQPRGPGRVPKE